MGLLLRDLLFVFGAHTMLKMLSILLNYWLFSPSCTQPLCFALVRTSQFDHNLHTEIDG